MKSEILDSEPPPLPSPGVPGEGEEPGRPDASAAPDWASVREPVCCPLCEYDLRGLAEPRCPECGYAFTWPDVLDPDRRLHPYLFEHHPERNAWSFRRTLLGTLRPRRFWTALRPAQPGRARRLVVYWLLAAVPLLLAAVAWSAKQTVNHVQSVTAMRARVRAGLIANSNTQQTRQIVKQFGSIDAYVDAGYPTTPGVRFYFKPNWTSAGPANGVVLAILAWPWLTFLTLLVFQFSMRRARVRTVHVLRCVLYGFDAVLWAGLIVAGAVAWQLYSGGATPPAWGRQPRLLSGLLGAYTLDPVARAALCAGVVLLPFMVYRTIVAYRTYLRFHRPAATVLASQIIVLLVVAVAFVRVQLQ